MIFLRNKRLTKLKVSEYNFVHDSFCTEQKIPNMQQFRLITFSIALILWMTNILTSGNAITLVSVIYLWTGGHYTLYLIRHTLWRDMRLVVLYTFVSRQFKICFPCYLYVIQGQLGKY